MKREKLQIAFVLLGIDDSFCNNGKKINWERCYKPVKT